MKNSILTEIEWYSRQNINSTFRAIAIALKKINIKDKKINITDLAAMSFTTASSITRFCNQLGYDGYKELINRLFIELEFTTDKSEKNFKNIVWSDDFIFNSTFENLIKDIQKVNDNYYYQVLSICQSIAMSKKVYIVANNESKDFANYLYNNLLSMKIDVFLLDNLKTFQSIVNQKIEKNSFSFISFIFGEENSWIKECNSEVVLKDQSLNVICSPNNYVGYKNIDELVIKNNSVNVFENNDKNILIFYIINQICKIVANKIK